MRASPSNFSYAQDSQLKPQHHLAPNLLNFSGGPGALPESVLLEIQSSIIDVPGVGLSILGISHRSDWFADIVAETSGNIRQLLGLSNDFHVLFLQGGATQQFFTVPMALLTGSKAPAEYLHTGYWSGKSIVAAQSRGPIRVAWSGQSHDFRRLPTDDELSLAADAPYFHYVSNETVEGLQFDRVVGREGVPRVCDMSSDFLSRPCEASRYSLIYAHAQKNLGPAGVTVVVVRDDLVKAMRPDLPGFLDYRQHIAARSNLNTPPVFAIYVVALITRWLLADIGGLAKMAEINRSKASCLYRVIDTSGGYFKGRTAPEHRSMMNVVFNLPTPDLEACFLKESAENGFSGLAGHRSIGGIRASIYNGVSLEAAAALADFMADFKARHGI